MRGIGDLNGRAGRSELRQRLVGDDLHQDVDLHLVVRIDAQLAALNRVLRRFR